MSERVELPEAERRQLKRSHDEVSFAPFVLKVPAGDPFLARLIAVHGKDTVERAVRVATRKTAA